MRTVFFLLIITSVNFQLYAQDTTNAGTEFWVGYGHHQYMEQNINTQHMTLYISTSDVPAIVTVTIDSSSALSNPAFWWSRTYTIPANTVIALDNPLHQATSHTGNAGFSGEIPKGLSGQYDARLYSDPPPIGNASEGIFRKKAIHVQSSVPVVVYAHIYGSVSSGATMLVPVEAWGGLYTSANSDQTDTDNAFSWLYVVAAYDNTVVEITPSVTSRLGKPAGVPFTVTLHKGHIYQLLGGPINSSSGYQLTGTKVRSVMSPTGFIHPIGVFSGSSRTAGSISLCGGSGRDNDIQQHFPRQAWGKRYLTVPTSNSASASTPMTNVYKVIVTDPATVVTRNGVPLVSLTPASYYQFSSSTADLIEADQPILVAQFMSGGIACSGGGDGDPEMFYLSPISQGTKKAVFYRNNREAINTNYLSMVIPTNGLASLTIDGASTFSHTYAHPNLSGYSVVVQRWTSANAQCIVMSDSAFTGITYGLGGAESYGYNIGTRLNAVNARDASVLPPGFTGVLPLTLLNFSATKQNPDVLLKWNTAQEINFNRFEVERSLNGIEFTRFATIESGRAGSGMYSTPDANALKLFNANPVIYYRLKMLDNDGKFKYSGIVTIKPGKLPSLEVMVAPNPFTDKLQLQIQTGAAGIVRINIMDVSGKLIDTRSKYLNTGGNLVEIPSLAHLQNGIYIVEVELNGLRQYLKAIK
jgi:hypothetical protein